MIKPEMNMLNCAFLNVCPKKGHMLSTVKLDTGSERERLKDRKKFLWG